ncbi:hypothetical protein LJC11_04025, partial [Bacteroidales bacterium OttesenSCG-928-I21]|nr:hypothetical protein [Bacteroidales bacterium OttesenSCG-928-I21]
IQPVVDMRPSTGNLCAGGNVYLNVSNKSDFSSTSTYNWFHNGEIIQSSSYSFYYATSPGKYFVEVVEGQCSSVSEIKTVKNNAGVETITIPSIISTSNTNNICGNQGMIVLALDNASAFSGTTTFQWFKDGVALTGGDATSIVYRATEAGNYSLSATDGECAAMSDIFEVKKDGTGSIVKPVLNMYQSSGEICTGGNIFLSVNNVSSYTNPTYIWFKDGAIIQGADKPYYTATATGKYFVQVIDGSCTSASDSKEAKQGSGATETPTIMHNGSSANICADGGRILLQISNLSLFNNPTFQWFKDGFPIDENSTNIHLKVNEAGAYSVLITEGGCSAMSAPINITKDGTGSIPRPVLLTSPPDGELCQGGNIFLYVSEDISRRYVNPVYRWYKDNVLVETTQDSGFRVDSPGEYFVEVIDGACSAVSLQTVIEQSQNTISQLQMDISPASLNVCENGTVVFQITTNYQSPRYEWYKDNTLIPNENTGMYATTEAGEYYAAVYEGSCMAVSDVHTVTSQGGQIVEPVIKAYPSSVIETNPIELRLENPDTDYTNPSYRWYKGKQLVGNTKNLQVNETGIYKLLVVDNNNCAIWSNEIEVTKSTCFIDKPVIVSVPAVPNVCTPNGAVLLQLNNMSSYDSPTFQWYKNGVAIPGETNPTLDVTAAGNYKIEVFADGCSKTSDEITVTASAGTIAKPVVKRIPQNENLCGTNGTIVLRFENASSLGGTWQWYKDGYAIPGATQEIYKASDAGKYRVVYTEGACMAMSDEEDIQLRAGSVNIPILAKSPNTDEICINGNIRLSVQNASDYPNATYYWYKGTEEVQVSALSSYVATEAGTYFVQVVNENSCSAVSAETTLKMSTTNTITAPDITVYPTNKNICGEDGIVVITLNNTNDYTSPSYQWYKNGLPIDGETKNIYSATEAGDYYLEIKDGATCSAVTAPVTVTKTGGDINKPVITAFPPEAVIVENGGVVSLSLQNESDFPNNPVYYWFKQTEGSSVWTIVGANAVSYNADEKANYRLLVVEDDGCAAWSNTIFVDKNICSLTPPLLSYAPSSLKACLPNGSVLLQLQNIAAYANSPVYEWYKDNVAITPAQTSPTLEVTEAGAYRIKVTQAGCSKYSNPVTVTNDVSTFTEKPAIEVLPGNAGICGNNGSVILHITNAGEFAPTATYQWYKNNYEIPDATGTIYIATEAGNYRLAVNDGDCMSLSAAVTVNKISNEELGKPEISLTPDNGQFCTGGSIRIMVTNTGEYSATAVYVWFKDDVEVQRGNNPLYFARVAGEYFVQVVDGLCASVSVKKTLSPPTAPGIDEPVIISYPSTNTICATDGVVVLRLDTDNAVYGNTAVYQWYKDGESIPGANEIVYSAQTAGKYMLEVVEDDCASVSGIIEVIDGTSTGTITAPNVSMIPLDGKISVAMSETATITLNNTADYTNPTYYWFRGTELLTTETSSTLVTGQPGTYKLLIVEDDECAIWSQEFVVMDSQCNPAKPQVSVTPSTNTVCGINGSALLQFTNVSDYVNPTYQWYHDGVLLPGKNGLTLELSGAQGSALDGDYTIEVTDQGCNISSDPETITFDNILFIDKPMIEAIPNNANICGTRGSVMLRWTNPTIDNTSYQWFKNGFAIPGATNLIYEATEAGSYQLQIMNNDCMSMSLIEVVTKDNSSITRPMLIKEPNVNTVCADGGIRMTVGNHQLYTNPTYIWYKDDKRLYRGDRYVAYAVGPGTYFVQVLDESGCSSTSLKEIITLSGTTTEPNVKSYSQSDEICGVDGVVLLRLENADAYHNPIYQWYNKEDMIPGANEIIYVVTQPGDYYLDIKDGECSTVSSLFTITDNPLSGNIEKPKISFFPPDKYIVKGQDVEMEVTNTDDYSTNAVYYWFKNNDIIKSGVGETTCVATEEGLYRVLVVDGDCSSLSDFENITKEQNCDLDYPQVESIVSNKICDDAGVVLLKISNLSVYQSPAFEWYRNNQLIPQETSSTLITNIAGSYKLKITSNGCHVFSNTSTILVDEATQIKKPTVALEPLNGEICGSQGSVIMRWNNEGDFVSGATCQWYRDGVAIGGATEVIYEATQPGKYLVAVIDGDCMAMSAEADIKLNTTGSTISKPKLSKIPNVTEICTGGSISLSVTNTSDYQNPVYNWYKGTTIVQTGNNPHYIATSAGTYFVQVAEGTCSATSVRETLTMSAAGNISTPHIEKYPSTSGGKVCGNNGVFVLTLTNPGDFQSPTYQWYKDGVAIPNAKDVLYSATEKGNYHLEVVDGSCAVSTSAVAVDVNPAGTIEKPNVSLFPSDGVIQSGGNVLLTLENTGDYSSSAVFHWFKDKKEIAVGETYTATQKGKYRLLVVDGDCAAWSDEFDLTDATCTAQRPTLTVLPESLNICSPNGSVLLRVNNRSDYQNPTYQWYKNTQEIAGQTNPTLEVTEAGTYLVRVIEDGCRAFSEEKTITRSDVPTLEKPLVESIPQNAELCGSGSTVVLRFTNPDMFAGMSYQWYKDNYPIASATNVIYEAKEAGKYRIVVLDGNSCMAMSAEIDLKRNTGSDILKPNVTKFPNTTEICQNGEIRLYVNNTSGFTGATYVWYKGTEEVQRGALATYIAKEAGQYFVQVYEGTCSNVSDKIDITVSGSNSISVPQQEVYPASGEICGNDGVVVIRLKNISDYSGATLRWYKNGTVIQGENNPLLSVTETGTYYLEITLGSCLT